MQHLRAVSMVCVLAYTFVSQVCMAQATRPAESALPAPTTTVPDEDNGPALFVLEWYLAQCKPEEVLFVATGHSRTEGWIDPSRASMERLRVTRPDLRAASEARHPRPGEMANDRAYRGIEDPKSGKAAFIHFAVVVKWIDQNTAEVRYGRNGGPLSGNGGSVIAARKDGKWFVKEKMGAWVS